jgi:hypothetical protein
LEDDQTTSRQDIEVQIAKVNEAKINLQVYEETQDIYVGAYKNQQMIDLEKQEMDDDLSYLLLNSYIGVPINQCKNKRNFWIAKVEKVVEQNEKNIPKMIQVLWHAVKKGQDLWKRRYLLEVIRYEKQQGKKGRGVKFLFGLCKI